MERQTYQQILDRLKGVDSWLLGHGIANNVDRIRLHIHNIANLKQAYEDGTLKKLTDKRGTVELMWSLVEGTEFADIYTALRDYDPGVLRKKLRDALKGPVAPPKETSRSNIGRNTMFELNLASRLVRARVPVCLGAGPDILCHLDRRAIYIQCKRPLGEKKIQRSISKARKQLTHDLDESQRKSARGVIAISFSRILNPGDKLFVVRRQNMMTRLSDEIRDLAEKQCESWEKIVDTRIIGVLFHLITPAFIEDINLLVAAQEIAVFNVKPPLIFPVDSDGLMLRDLGNLLKRKS